MTNVANKRVRGAWTLEKLAERVRKGYGQGSMSSYIPWIGVRDFSSIGTSTRMWSPKTGRMMEFLSNIERDTFLVAEFREDFVDYWEQWPLKRSHTLRAAKRLGYRHSIYFGGKIPLVMTVDGVLTTRGESRVHRKAIDCKHSKDLENPRTLEKLSITRTACHRVSLPHVLITEKAISPQLVRSILWIRMALPKTGEIEPVPNAFEVWPMRLHKRLLERPAHATVSNLCRAFDAEFELPKGFALRCMKLLMWQHLVTMDMHTDRPERTLLTALTISQPKTLLPLTVMQRLQTCLLNFRNRK